MSVYICAELGLDYLDRAASVCPEPAWPGCHVIAGEVDLPRSLQTHSETIHLRYINQSDGVERTLVIFDYY